MHHAVGMNRLIFYAFSLILKLLEALLHLQALDIMRGKNVLMLMDSSLEGQYASDDATNLVELASKCLQSEARDRPDTKFLLTAVAPLQKQKEVKNGLILKFFSYFYNFLVAF